MASIAQIKRDRLSQLRKLGVAIRDYNTKQEILVRLIRRFKTKHNIIEADDMKLIDRALTGMDGGYDKVRGEVENLARIISAS